MRKLASEIELSQLIGENALLRLERDRGGATHYIPATERGYTEFKSTLTLSEFRILIDYYGGSNLHIPKNLAKAHRDHEIQERYESGECSRDLAEQYHLTDRQIRNITNGEVR